MKVDKNNKIGSTEVIIFGVIGLVVLGGGFLLLNNNLNKKIAAQNKSNVNTSKNIQSSEYVERYVLKRKPIQGDDVYFVYVNPNTPDAIPYSQVLRELRSFVVTLEDEAKSIQRRGDGIRYL